MLHDVIFYTLFIAFGLYGICRHDIQAYFYNKKSPEEKYRLWRKSRADYNHENGIVDEFQYDYMLNSNDVRQQD